MPETLYVYVLSIHVKDATLEPHVFRHRQDAEEALVKWVECHWAQEPQLKEQHKPTNPKELVERYFDALQGTESYQILECVVMETLPNN